MVQLPALPGRPAGSPAPALLLVHDRVPNTSLPLNPAFRPSRLHPAGNLVATICGPCRCKVDEGPLSRAVAEGSGFQFIACRKYPRRSRTDILWHSFDYLTPKNQVCGRTGCYKQDPPHRGHADQNRSSRHFILLSSTVDFHSYPPTHLRARCECSSNDVLMLCR